MKRSLSRWVTIIKISDPLVLLGLLALLASHLTIRAVCSTSFASTNRVLIIDASSTPVATGKATLRIGVLRRDAGVFAGEYEIQVSPLFFKGEKGKLAIVVSDESLAQVHNRKLVEVTGTATTSGGGKTRRIDAIATPSDSDQGTLKLWFVAGERKMVFETAYHFAEKEAASSQTKTMLK